MNNEHFENFPEIPFLGSLLKLVNASYNKQLIERPLYSPALGLTVRNDITADGFLGLDSKTITEDKTIIDTKDNNGRAKLTTSRSEVLPSGESGVVSNRHYYRVLGGYKVEISNIEIDNFKNFSDQMLKVNPAESDGFVNGILQKYDPARRLVTAFKNVNKLLDYIPLFGELVTKQYGEYNDNPAIYTSTSNLNAMVAGLVYWASYNGTEATRYTDFIASDSFKNASNTATPILNNLSQLNVNPIDIENYFMLLYELYFKGSNVNDGRKLKILFSRGFWHKLNMIELKINAGQDYSTLRASSIFTDRLANQYEVVASAALDEYVFKVNSAGTSMKEFCMVYDPSSENAELWRADPVSTFKNNYDGGIAYNVRAPAAGIIPKRKVGAGGGFYMITNLTQ